MPTHPNGLKLIDSYSDETRATYAQGEITFDVIYPIVYTLFISVTLMLPYAVFAADMFENTGTVTMLYNYPSQLTRIIHHKTRLVL